MVWINAGNISANNVIVTDDIPLGTVYVDGSLTCEARGNSTVVSCVYIASENRVEYRGEIDADLGAATEAEATNEVVIHFRTRVLSGVTSIENQGLAYWDFGGDGSAVDDQEGGQTPVVTDDPTRPGGSDVTLIVLATPEPINVPINSSWMLMLMSLLITLTAFGARRLRITN